MISGASVTKDTCEFVRREERLTKGVANISLRGGYGIVSYLQLMTPPKYVKKHPISIFSQAILFPHIVWRNR